MFNNEIVIALFAALAAGHPSHPPPDSPALGKMTTPAQRQQARLDRLTSRPVQQSVVLAQIKSTVSN